MSASKSGFAVNPVLARDAVPPLACRQPGEPRDPAPALLGWNTWLPTSRGHAAGERDAADAVFEAEIVEGRA